MFSSFFATVDPTAPTFHPIGDAIAPNELFGELEPKDLEWTIGSGFITETQIWYQSLEDGTFLLLQIIHSSVGMWYPTVQFACKIYDPKSKEQTWHSINTTGFVTPPPSTSNYTYDKRSSKADQFSVIHHGTSTDPLFAESYKISVNISDDLQISLVVSRPSAVPGFKVGKGPNGGFSYFGPDKTKAEGYVIHRFWPRTQCTGLIMHKGKAITADGTGMFVHAIQGMRPNLIAASWNFADFQSKELGGVSAIQMEFTTTDAYGRKGAGSGGVVVNIGSVVVAGKLASVTAETKWPDADADEEALVKSRAEHLGPVLDPETGYKQPSSIKFTWKAPSVLKDAPGTVKAELTVDVGPPTAPNGLVEKVDVLAEIPYVLKAFVNYVAGTKPYIYQWLNPATLSLTAPTALIEGSGDGDKTVSVTGTLYNEATFIS